MFVLVAIPDLVSEIDATELLVGRSPHGLVFHRHRQVSVASFLVAVDFDFLRLTPGFFPRHSITTFKTEFIKSSVST
jgi:hypothetical protein